MIRVEIESIKPSGDCGMYKAVLSVDMHGHAIEVIGKNLTECVFRANLIVEAFKKAP